MTARQIQSTPGDAAALRDYHYALARVFTTLRAANITAWGREPLRLPGTDGLEANHAPG